MREKDESGTTIGKSRLEVGRKMKNNMVNFVHFEIQRTWRRPCNSNMGRKIVGSKPNVKV